MQVSKTSEKWAVKKIAFCLMEMMNQISFAGVELWQGLAGRNCPWGFAQISAYFFHPWDVPICFAFNPFPYPEVCERPGLVLSSTSTSTGFPSMDPKPCSFLESRTRGERGTCWGSRAAFPCVVREDTPRPQILQQYLLWLWMNMRTHQGGGHRECFVMT